MRVLFALISAIAICIQVFADDNVVCNRFIVTTVSSGRILSISLDTDLPDKALLYVGVWRHYTLKGIAEETAVAYESSVWTVAELKAGKQLTIDHEAWQKAVMYRQRFFYVLNGRYFRVADIDRGNLTLNVDMKFSQTELFGENNSKLHGTAVKGRSVKASQKVPNALNQVMVNRIVAYGETLKQSDPDDLNLEFRHNSKFPARIYELPENIMVSKQNDKSQIRYVEPMQAFTVLRIGAREKSRIFLVRTDIDDKQVTGWLTIRGLLGLPTR